MDGNRGLAATRLMNMPRNWFSGPSFHIYFLNSDFYSAADRRSVKYMRKKKKER